MSALTPDDIRRIAALARLRLDDDEVARIAAQFAGIIGHLERLRAVPTDGVEPLDHPLPLVDVLRDDVPRPGLSHDEALSGAPDAAAGQFRVPRVTAE
jgi:aspartyl-tRNA(Asn)/glutamyl-tRNA(Gln) amidotransferase subunit C